MAYQDGDMFNVLHNSSWSKYTCKLWIEIETLCGTLKHHALHGAAKGSTKPNADPGAPPDQRDGHDYSWISSEGSSRKNWWGHLVAVRLINKILAKFRRRSEVRHTIVWKIPNFDGIHLRGD